MYLYIWKWEKLNFSQVWGSEHMHKLVWVFDFDDVFSIKISCAWPFVFTAKTNPGFWLFHLLNTNKCSFFYSSLFDRFVEENILEWHNGSLLYMFCSQLRCTITCLNKIYRGSYMCAHIIEFIKTKWGKVIKCETCRAFYRVFATSWINSIIQEYEYKILFIILH